ncbi:hypothetical protein MNBD_PLANCTO03-1174 [hydrothermal vent metagenome]|uniref:Uncharacterized protein n=1 Tax=hydrothermal vent metagenome TaxID=652676 RepID=A0A3B1DNN6_9ZZZZ
MTARTRHAEDEAGAAPTAGHPAHPIDRFDPEWLFLVAGLVLLGFTVVIPAQADLARAEWQRDRTVAIEHIPIDEWTARVVTPRVVTPAVTLAASPTRPPRPPGVYHIPRFD